MSEVRLEASWKARIGAYLESARLLGRRTAEAGFDLHLVKPVDYEKLAEALRA